MRKRLLGAFSLFATCLGFLTDFPIFADGVEEAVGSVLPIAVAFLPWAAFAGSIFFGGLMLTWAIGSIPRLLRWYFDARDFDPEAERFQRCLQLMNSCLELLTSRLQLDEEERVRLLLGLRALEKDLQELDIDFPTVNPDELYSPVLRLRLQHLRVPAETKDIELARQPYDVGEFL